MLVVPTSLQMGWVESPPYFCTATETARDITTEYTNMPVGAIPEHKFSRYTVDGESYADRPEDHEGQPFWTMIEVYVDDFMSLVIPISKSQLQHTVAAVMMGIHDVFPAKDEDDGDDPISENKLKKLEGQYSTAKTLLGFDFDGIHKTMWLEAAKQESYSRSSKVGSAQDIGGPPESRSKNLNRRLQKYDMHSHASPWELVSSPRTIAS